jgi:hypothetical protein
MPERIEPTEELLQRLTEAQADHTADILRQHGFADDMGDYTNSALDVIRALFDMYWDQADLKALDLYLNTPQDPTGDGMIDLGHGAYKYAQLGLCASDGICQELYDLNCIAMHDPEDD